MAKFLTLFLATALLLPARALEISAPLTLVPSSSSANRFNVAVTASPATGSSTTNATGTVNLRMQVDPATGKVSELSFQEGKITFSNMTITLRAFIFITAATMTTNGLEGFAWTAAPPAPVNSANGIFDAALHRFTINKGTVNGTTAIAIGATPAGTTFGANFTEEPISGPGEGNGTITLTEIPASATPSTRTWRTNISLPLNLLQTTDLEGTSVTIRLTGTMRAESNLVIPRSDYYAWTIANNLPAPAFDSTVRPGEPYGMVWAMGLAPTAPLRPHLPSVILAGGPRAQLTLPAGGTAAPLIVEVSNQLTTGSWAPAPAASVTGGANPLPPGSKGTVNIQLTGPGQFVRLRANAP